jgi:hypothetical protein
VIEETGFERACSLLEEALQGDARREILTEISTTRDLGQALEQLRAILRSHTWRTGAGEVSLGRIVRAFDSRTREEGFHVLHDWDGKADHVNPDIIPIDVLDYVLALRGGEVRTGPDRTVVAILLDYYFLHVLALLSLRIWDAGDPDDNLNRLDRLLHELQGPRGSGQRFANNAETLILIATSHFELHDRGYGVLLERVRTLSAGHRLRIALGHAASMGSHLRFGFEATYRRDTVVMRDDNAADYPWLCFALATLMREYSAMHEAGIQGGEREEVVEATLNGLSADARAFVGEAPPSLSGSTSEDERAEFSERFRRFRPDLVAEFESCRPSDHRYSPLSLFFNFSHNIVKGTVIDALLRGEVWCLTLNDLLTGIPREGPRAQAKAQLARTLMAYARANPDRINGRPTPVIVYDASSGHQAFTVTMRKIVE